MHTDHLRGMRRSELQKLAKKYGIKANLKSEVIIEELLKSKFLHRDLASSGRLSFRATPVEEKIVINIPSEIAVAAGGIPSDDFKVINAEIMAPMEMQSDFAAKRFFEKSYLDPEDGAEILYNTTPTYTLSTPESSLAGTPEPEAPSDVLEDVSHSMAFLSKQNKQTLAHISRCRSLALRLRNSTEQLYIALRAHASRRERIQAFITYWRDIGSRWSYEDIWDAAFRIYVSPSGTDHGEVDTDADEKIIELENRYAQENGLHKERLRHNEAYQERRCSTTLVAQHYEEGHSEAVLGVSNLGASSSTSIISPPRVVGVKCLPVETGANGGVNNIVLDALTPQSQSREAKKRRRGEDIESNDDPMVQEGQARRYPRRRVQAMNATAPSANPEPAMNFVAAEGMRKAKGKRKMTSEEVDQMCTEREDDWQKAKCELAMGLLPVGIRR